MAINAEEKKGYIKRGTKLLSEIKAIEKQMDAICDAPNYEDEQELERLFFLSREKRKKEQQFSKIFDIVFGE